MRLALCDEEAVITIAGNGSGISEAMRASLFSSFKSSKPEGNGLGIWIVKEIVQNHRGRIQFRSRADPGKSGTTFRFAFRFGGRLAIGALSQRQQSAERFLGSPAHDFEL